MSIRYLSNETATFVAVIFLVATSFYFLSQSIIHNYDAIRKVYKLEEHVPTLSR